IECGRADAPHNAARRKNRFERRGEDVRFDEVAVQYVRTKLPQFCRQPAREPGDIPAVALPKRMNGNAGFSQYLGEWATAVEDHDGNITAPGLQAPSESHQLALGSAHLEAAGKEHNPRKGSFGGGRRGLRLITYVHGFCSPPP